MSDHPKIESPKRTLADRKGRNGWYPYYAGFSCEFARDLLASLELKPNSCVLDPWNGSGTTTTACASLGYAAVGIDLSPVMALVASARLLDSNKDSAVPSAIASILDGLSVDVTEGSLSEDPLETWLQPESARAIRCIENGFRSVLQVPTPDRHVEHPSGFRQLTELRAFLYVALFRTVRGILSSFVASNPTWVKVPKDTALRLKPDPQSVLKIFKTQAKSMVAHLTIPDPAESWTTTPSCLLVASSSSLPLEDGTVDVVLSSPPYCTRIDYAIATLPELAVLGYGQLAIRRLRQQLIGTPTVPTSSPPIVQEWGTTALTFLGALEQHAAKASATYYYKNHTQYFAGIYQSIGEISRVLKTGGRCILVVQDSYYKDIHNNLPQVFVEMAAVHGLTLQRRIDFPLTQVMARINPGARRYRKTFGAVESVLFFERRS